MSNVLVWEQANDHMKNEICACVQSIIYLLILTHWGRVTHICVSKLSIIGSDNGLSPGRRQAIIWTNAGILLIGALGTNVSEILIQICTFSWKKMLLKMSSGKRRPSCLGLNVLISLSHSIAIQSIVWLPTPVIARYVDRIVYPGNQTVYKNFVHFCCHTLFLYCDWPQ